MELSYKMKNLLLGNIKVVLDHPAAVVEESESQK
jgi:hypothetical protein